MAHTIDNTITADELNRDLPLLAEMPASTMLKDHHNLKQTGKGMLALASAGALAYVGNKAIDYFKNTTDNALTVDPNKDIDWDYN